MSATRYDAVRINAAGNVLVAASNLTGREWNGSITLFSDITDATSPGKRSTGATAETEAGVADVQWVDDRRFLAASDRGSVQLYEWRGDNTIDVVSEYIGHDDMVSSIAVKNGRMLTTSWDCSIKLWDIAASQAPGPTFSRHSDTVFAARWQSESNVIFGSVSQDSTFQLSDVRTPSSNQTHVLSVYATALCWHADPLFFALGHCDGTMAYYDSRNLASTIFTSSKQTSYIAAMDFSSYDKDLLACASDDKSVQVHNMAEKVDTYRNEEHKAFVRGLAWSPSFDNKTNTQTILTVGWDGKIIPHAIHGILKAPL